MTLSSRLLLAIECALVLFACSAGPGAFQVWRHGAERDGGYLMVVGIPASAALVFVGVASALPSLLAVGRLKFPLPLTLPVVYGGVLAVVATLWTTPTNGLVRNSEVIAYGLLWTQVGPLVVSGVLGMIGLEILSLLQGDA